MENHTTNNESRFKRGFQELGNIVTGILKVVGFVLALGIAISLYETGEVFPQGTNLYKDILAPILGCLVLGIVIVLIIVAKGAVAEWWNERKSKK